MQGGEETSLFNNDAPPTNMCDSPLSRHVRQFDQMMATQQQPHPTLDINALNHPVNANNSGQNSPDSPRTLAFRKKIGSLTSACRSAVSKHPKRPTPPKLSPSPRGHHTGMEFAFGDSTPRLPTRDYNQHGMQQPEMWPHQKSQETNNDALDNFESQEARKSSTFSSGHYTGGSDRWKMTPMPAAEDQSVQRQRQRHPTQHSPNLHAPSQRKRRSPAQQQSLHWRQKNTDVGLTLDGMGNDMGHARDGGPEIVLVGMEGMNLGGDDGNPFQYAPSPKGYGSGGHQQPMGGSPRLNGAIARTGNNVLVPSLPVGLSPNAVERQQLKRRQQREQQQRRLNQTNVELVNALPDEQSNVHPSLASGQALEIHRDNRRLSRGGGGVGGSRGGRGGRRNGTGRTDGTAQKKGPRIRRKNPGVKKELPSYMRPTAAMKNWTKQTADVKKMSKSERKKQIY